MWYDETKKRWYCTNKKCVKYKPQPQPEPAEEQAEESATDTNVGGKD
jgi:hypothetical protein